ncbi:hypothetical protein [Streptomyces sp. NPDC093225]|uniref:hypothetical protein n=1 Tax=Streptomyces sp. NPDC093225 TaxID=3366034 RepID=UPI0037F39DF3
MPTQIVGGAILTCASTSTTATSATCGGPKLDTLDIRLAVSEASAICAVVTRNNFNTASGSGSASPLAIWNGTTWELSSVADTPMTNIVCNR